jgi:ABC-type branched-subunit amino acid transport system substrate-binding protein
MAKLCFMPHSFGMKRYLVIGICAVCAVAAISAYHSRSSPSPDKITVGVLLPLSQDFAWWGDTIRDAIILAQKEGYMKDAEFIYEDTKCDTKDAVTGLRSIRAIHPETHMFIVGCDNDLKAMNASMEPKADIAFMVGLSDQSLYASGFPTINLAYRLESEAAAAAEFAANKLSVRSLGIFVDNNNFGRTLASTSVAYMQRIGGTSITETLKYNETSPDTSVLKVLAAKPDAVYMQNDIPGMSAILKRLSQLGFTGKRILYYGGRDQSLIDAAGPAAENAYVPWVIPIAASTERASFESDFKKTYGKEPFITAYFTYDGMEVLDGAVHSCGTDTTCIAHAFYEKTHDHTLGPVRYEPNGQVDRAFRFQQIRGGKFVDVE